MVAVVQPAAEVITTGSRGVSAPALKPYRAPAIDRRLPLISNDPEQEYFADGITEDLTTDIARFRAAQDATPFTYKGKPVDATRIGRDLASGMSSKAVSMIWKQLKTPS